MKLNVSEELQAHLPKTNKKGFYALYNFKDDILYTIGYFNGKKFKCWLQMHLSGPEMGWKSYGGARITTPLSYNIITFLKDAIRRVDIDTLFFYLGE